MLLSTIRRFLPLLLLVQPSQSDGGFIYSCFNEWVQFGVLHAICWDAGGAASTADAIQTGLDLDYCIVNAGGTIYVST